jgi:multicomponent Na+:H+ antiporter subunit D
MVAYSSSAQISYIFMALGLGTRAGVAAACFQVLAHAFTKPMIFVGAGRMIRVSGGGHYWSDLRGAGWRNPLAGLAFTIGGLSLCGIPLLAGFSAKYQLATAALGATWQTLPALFGLAASSLLNAMYYIPAILVIWSKTTDGQVVVKEDGYRSWEFYIAVGCFLVCNVLLGTAIEPIFAVIYQGLALL